MGRIVLTLMFGLLGCGILVSLGTWQVQRLGWKEAVLAEISARIADEPVPLPAAADPQRDQYLAVTATGTLRGDTIRVLVSQKGQGAGYRLITPLDLGSRQVLLDRGILPVAAPLPPLPEGRVTVTGNLLWPDEVDGFTPDPDLDDGLWFARDLPAMAAELNADPLLIVLRDRGFDDGAAQPVPVGISGIPNDHLGYAITWFSLALVWAGMTAILVWRMTRPKAEG